MAELPTLEALQAFHQELEALRDGRASAVAVFESPHLVQAFEQELDRFWQRPPKSEQSRNSVKSGMYLQLAVRSSCLLTLNKKARSLLMVTSTPSTKTFNRLRLPCLMNSTSTNSNVSGYSSKRKPTSRGRVDLYYNAESSAITSKENMLSMYYDCS